jgi:hypothetical protein
LRNAKFAVLLVLLAAAPAAAQLPQPTVFAPPSGPDFLSRYDFHLAASALAIDDQRFSWDTHFGGSIDLADYVAGRTAMRVDYEAVLGNEYRAFDPNQGNYTLEGSSSARIGPNTEVVGMFHHVSRHLGDRPKREAIAWNELGVRILQRVKLGDTTVDADVEGGPVVQHSDVDYRWIGELGLQVRRPITPRVGAFFQGFGTLIGVDETVNGRGTQAGGVGEVGIRISGRGGALELFAGVERRIDAYPIGIEAKQWVLAGFRLVSR